MSRGHRRPAHRRGSPHSPARLRGIGAIVLAGLGLAVYAVFVRSVPWSQPWTVSAVFANSAQITAGSPVRIAGLDVGHVAGVGRGPGTTALVTMEIGSSGRPLHVDATASIRPRLFLEGGYYVDLHPGSPSTPTLSAGATLPLPQTSVPVSFSTVLSTLTAPVRSSLVDVIDGFAHGLADGGAAGLHDGLHVLGPALRTTAIASEGLVGTGPGDVSAFVRGADRVTTALAARAAALTEAITAEARLATALADREPELTASVDGVDATLATAAPALAAVSAALPELRSFAGELDPSLRAAPPALRGTSGLLAQVQALVARRGLPRLVDLAGPLATDVAALAPKLDSLFPRVREVSSCAGDQLVALLDAKLNDGALSTGQTVWQELAHVNVGLASANQDFDAAGTRVRFATNVQPNLLALGSIPGVGVLLQNAEQPVLGIRPQWSGPTPPPVHPEIPCSTQPLGDLQAAAVAMPAATTRVTVDTAGLTGLIRARLRRATTRWTP
jgi:virulence factor Mce-like protein